MRRFSLLACRRSLSACAHAPKHIAVDGAVLGRVVIYRNGVAFYERTAKVTDGRVTVQVPRDRVDDFLKSLTVVDPHTRKPLAVSIPRQEADDGSYLTMTLETAGPQHADVLLTYVTESPAWKPSYRVVVGADNKVMLEGWAIVDNVSGEDWKGVLVGVGASSALSFRYDLWSVRRIDRDLLQGEERFAIAPPTGVSPYAESRGRRRAGRARRRRGARRHGATAYGVSFSGSSSLENQYFVDGINTTGLDERADGVVRVDCRRRSSGLRGAVTDKKTGEKLAGVTVVATTKGSQGHADRDHRRERRLRDRRCRPAATTSRSSTATRRSSAKASTSPANQADAGLPEARRQHRRRRDDRDHATRAPIDRSDVDATQGITITQRLHQEHPGRPHVRAARSAPPRARTATSAAPPPPPPIKQGDAKLAGIVEKVAREQEGRRDRGARPASAEVAEARRQRSRTSSSTTASRRRASTSCRRSARTSRSRCACSRSRRPRKPEVTAPPPRALRAPRCPTRRSARATSWPIAR